MPAAPSPPTSPTAGTAPTEAKKVRRFAPEPIEQTTKSSKAARTDASEKGDAPKPRRFAPQIVEQSPKSSRQNSGQTATDTKPRVRRFAPEPVEVSHISSKDKEGKSAKSKFAPEPFETTTRSNRTDADQKPVRKFAPVLIDTAQRSRKGGDTLHAPSQHYRTEDGHHLHAREHRRHITGTKTPVDGDTLRAPRPQREPRFQHVDFAAEMPRRPVSPLDGSPPCRSSSLNPGRTHSFRCPDLDTIESSESERESGPSSRSCSPAQGSPITASDSSFTELYKHATRIRESVDENFAQYLLQLEAKKAEERLREQALAAFPNSDFHEPVEHYVNDDQESDEFEYEDRVVTWSGFDEDELLTLVRRRESTKVPWEQLELQRHAERMERERGANGTARENSRSPWWNPAHGVSVHDPDHEMRSMRDRARPPMLGRDLVFPRCPSPEPARFDVTQGSSILRQQLGSGSGSGERKKAGEASLWMGGTGAGAQTKKSSGDKKVGLWGGFCVGNGANSVGGDLAPPAAPTGLMTPRAEAPNPFEQSFAAGHLAARAGAVGGVGGLGSGGTSHGMLATPPTPPAEPRSAPDMAAIDHILVTNYELEKEIALAYPDSFVTQVFNYLSLGYPSLAWPYDAELSKISRIPLADLRADDAKARAAPRGYIRLGPDMERHAGGEGNGEENAIREYDCARWKALKLYIHEWARQEKNMSPAPAEPNAGPGGVSAGGQFGAVIERRGSWGI